MSTDYNSSGSLASKATLGSLVMVGTIKKHVLWIGSKGVALAIGKHGLS